MEKRRNCSLGAISLFHNIFDISLNSRVQLHINLLNVVVRIIFSSVLQIWYVDVRISRSISEGPLEFEITRVDCICRPYLQANLSLCWLHMFESMFSCAATDLLGSFLTWTSGQLSFWLDWNKAIYSRMPGQLRLRCIEMQHKERRTWKLLLIPKTSYQLICECFCFIVSAKAVEKSFWYS